MNRYITDAVKKRASEVEEFLVDGCFSAGVSISQRSFWDNITKIDKDELFATAEAYINEPFPEFTDEEYLDTNMSKNIDAICFKSIRRIEQAVLAECVENKGRFISYIREGIKSVCSRKSWVRACHDSIFSYSDFNGVHKLVDLYSSSLGCRMATIDVCIGELLGDDIRELLKDKVKEHVLDVFFKRLHEEPEKIKINGVVPLYWLDAFDNWLCVCLSGVVCAGLYFCENKDKALLIALYEKIIKKYLNSLPGGFCVEGLSYYGYGFGKFIAASDLIARTTNAKVDLYTTDGFREAASFGFKIGITEDVYPSAADCAFGTVPLSFCMKYFAHRAGLDFDYKYEDFKLDINIVLMMINPYDKLKSTMEYTSNDRIRTLFPEQGILISRNNKNDFGVYIQAGNNHAPHNHNDIGNFIIAKDKETFVVDPGVAEYGPKSFTPERYSIEVLSSLGHSVPKVAGKLQGPEKFGAINHDCSGDRPDNAYEEIVYTGKIIETDFSEDKDRVLIDMKNAYDVENLVSLQRELIFDRSNETVTVTDSFEFTEEEDFESAFVTFMSTEVIDNTHLLICGDKNCMEVEYSGNDGSISVSCVDGAVQGEYITKENITVLHTLRIAKRVRAKSGAVKMKFRIV